MTAALSIPPADVVPEPTAEIIDAVLSLAATAAKEQGYDSVTQVLFSLARRCCDLEAKSLSDHVTIVWQSAKIAKLEAEVERLRDQLREARKDVLYG